MSDGADRIVPGAAGVLAGTYRQVIGFIHERAARGDVTAARLSLALHTPGTPAPSRIDVRRWLANVASESRVYADPEIAAQLIAAQGARERLVPTDAERIWQAVAREPF
jgi:hypothetical protein